MATVSKKNPPAPAPRQPSGTDREPSAANVHWLLRGFETTYRFLASLKLAVFCILTLAAVLAAATFFESSTTAAASRMYIYQNPLFGILLTFLGTNVFCAATIRYPWKKRQIGFLVTHVGLLVILGGAFLSLKFSDEGQLGMAEGATSSEVERDHSLIKIQKVEPSREAAEGFKVVKTYALPFAPGVFSWDSATIATLARTPEYQHRVLLLGISLWTAILTLAAVVLAAIFGRDRLKPRLTLPLIGGLVLLVGYLVILNRFTPATARFDVLSNKSDPFTFVVRDFMTSANPFQKRTIGEMERDGDPLIRLALLAQPPGAATAKDSFGGDGWFAASDSTFGRDSKDAGQALISYQAVQGPHTEEVIDDFLHPPANPMKDRVARFFYKDNSGRKKSYDWTLTDGLMGKSITLPDSDLSVKLIKISDSSLTNTDMPQAAQIRAALGEKVVHILLLEVQRGKGEAVKHYAMASLPTFQNSALDGTPDEMVRIRYFHPPAINQAGGMGGRLGVIEVLGTEDGRYFYRVFGRTGLRGSGPLEMGKAVPVLGGGNMPMKISLELAEAIKKGLVREVYVPLKLPREKKEEGQPAIEAELTIDGMTKKLSLLRSAPVRGQTWGEFLRFPGGIYRVSYDFDREPVPFRLDLTKFTPGKDPGSGSFATYKSFVELSDPEMGLKNEPKLITMNEPLTHRGWTFYQSSFARAEDPETGQPDGLYLSIFQVHYDPAWRVIYTGCALVVLGIFLQFYMRAGVFTDGGKLEKAREEARTRKKAGLPASPASTNPNTDTLETL